MSDNRCRLTQPGGFTLTELLITLAIMAALASILLPVFARARERGRRTVCQSNLFRTTEEHTRSTQIGVTQFTPTQRTLRCSVVRIILSLRLLILESFRNPRRTLAGRIIFTMSQD